MMLMMSLMMFQHTAARRRLVPHPLCQFWYDCFNTQPPEGGWLQNRLPMLCQQRFNTQPPEGGWVRDGKYTVEYDSFNTQPPEGGWHATLSGILLPGVSTHSRPKAAGMSC